MIREFGLSIKFRWSGGGGKRFVRGLGRAENKKKWLSEGSDEQKTEKIAFRGLGRIENGENRLSAVAEE